MLKLGEVPGDCNISYRDTLAKEFPFSDYWIWEEEEHGADFKTKLEQIHYGSLILGTDGCGMYWILIVRGKEKGQIWQISDVGIQPCAPRVTFLDWYEYWLDGGSDWWRDFTWQA
jgi:hypothetical protein